MILTAERREKSSRVRPVSGASRTDGQHMRDGLIGVTVPTLLVGVWVSSPLRPRLDSGLTAPVRLRVLVPISRCFIGDTIL
jgi:hypothetical protein